MQREKVLKEVFAAEGHFEADDLASRLRRKDSRISRATTYHTLPLLLKPGLLNQVVRGAKHQHYEHVNKETQHDHLICLKCGKVIEVSNKTLKAIEEKICAENHFRP